MKEVLKNLNYLAILVLSAFYFALGFLWYSPVLFSKPWLATLERPWPEIQKAAHSMPVLMIGMIVSSIVIIFVLALVLNAIKVKRVFSAILFSLIISLGFVVLPSFASHLFEARNLVHFAINFAYPVTGIVISSIFLTVWRKKNATPV